MERNVSKGICEDIHNLSLRKCLIISKHDSCRRSVHDNQPKVKQIEQIREMIAIEYFQLSSFDYLIFIFLLFASLLIGIFYGWKAGMKINPKLLSNRFC